MTSYVYAHVRATGDRAGSIFYIGKGTGRRAWYARNRNDWWHHTVEKYGHEVIILAEGLTDEEAFELEAELVDALREHLCNLHEGGCGASSGALHPMYGKPGPWRGKTHSPEARAKMSASKTGPLHPMYGKPSPMRGKPGTMRGKAMPPEARAKISASKTGKTHSPEARAKMSTTRRAKNPNPSPRALRQRARKQKRKEALQA